MDFKQYSSKFGGSELGVFFTRYVTSKELAYVLDTPESGETVVNIESN